MIWRLLYCLSYALSCNVTVYVDDMRAPFGRMIMCHMTADTQDELLAFADNLGLNVKWKQEWDTPLYHFDISLGKRKQAVTSGAVEITWREMGAIITQRRKLTPIRQQSKFHVSCQKGTQRGHREMVARKATGTRRAAPAKAATRTRRPAEEVEEAPRTRRAPAKRTQARKAAPAAKPTASRDVTQYADKEPTPYHKAFATWLVKEVGVKFSGLSAKEAFLLGVSTATAARNSFMDSDFLAEWREKNGVAKRGPKRTEAEATRRSNRAVVSDDEFEPADDEADDDDDFEASDDVDEADDDFDDDSDEPDADDDDDFDDEPEPAPVARKRTTKAAPAKRTSRKVADDDDDGHLF